VKLNEKGKYEWGKLSESLWRYEVVKAREITESLPLSRLFPFPNTQVIKTDTSRRGFDTG